MRENLVTSVFAMLLLSPFPARSEIIYTYMGNDFTSGCTSCSVDGNFEVSSPLGDNLGDTSSGYSSITPDAFSFTNNDGLSITNRNEFQSAFSFKTDSNGNIVDWVIELTYDNSFGSNIVSFNCDICNVPVPGSGVADSTYFGGAPEGQAINDPGIWTEAPEPSPFPLSFVMLLVALLSRRNALKCYHVITREVGPIWVERVGTGI
jgi:hypothetical protein